MIAHKLPVRIWLVALLVGVLLPSLALAGDGPSDADHPTTGSDEASLATESVGAETTEPEVALAILDPADFLSDASCGAAEPSVSQVPALSASPWIPGPVSGGCGSYPACIGACGARGTPGDPCVCQCACEC